MVVRACGRAREATSTMRWELEPILAKRVGARVPTCQMRAQFLPLSKGRSTRFYGTTRAVFAGFPPRFGDAFWVELMRLVELAGSNRSGFILQVEVCAGRT